MDMQFTNFSTLVVDNIPQLLKILHHTALVPYLALLTILSCIQSHYSARDSAVGTFAAALTMLVPFSLNLPQQHSLGIVIFFTINVRFVLSILSENIKIS